MYRTLLKYYFLFLALVFGLTWLVDYYYQAHQQKQAPQQIEVGVLVTMVQQYCQQHGCHSEQSLPFSQAQLLSQDTVAFTPQIKAKLANGDAVSVVSGSGQQYYYSQFEADYILELGPFPKQSQSGVDGYSLFFFIMLGSLLLLMVWPLFREMWRIKDAASQFEKEHDLTQLQLPDSYFFQPVKDTLNWMLNKIARLLALQKELSSTLSHELRTNLASIKFSLASLNEQNLAESKAQMQHDVAEIQQLLDQYLSFAKQEHEEPQLNLTKVRLSPEITDYLNKVQVFSAKQVTFDVLDDAEVTVDMAFLVRAIRNLIDNAFKYSKANIAIQLYREQQWLVLQVDDDGKGFSSVHIDELFIPFTRKDQSQLGYGLGLAITKKIVEWHKGQIIAQPSTLLSGACFQLKLPLINQP